MLDEAAQRSPESEAFRCNGKALTYGELQLKSDRLADALRTVGVTSGDRVGIYLKKSLDAAVAIYGIWKARAAYVPLDPTAPVERLSAILGDAGGRHLIVNDSVKANLADLVSRAPQLQTVIGCARPADSDVSTIEFVPWSELSSFGGDRQAAPRPQPDDLAYLMYTSGSTGEPKGIMHTHFSGLSYAKLAAATYDLRPEDRLGNHAALHFDQSTMEYFASPLVGATTIIIPEIYTKLPASLSQLIDDEKMTIWYSVPFALIRLLQGGALDERDLSSLRWVLFGGESFPLKYLSELMRRLPGATFSNVYGPAEVNQCTYFHFPAAKDPSTFVDGEIPIGKIWGETQGIVVDDDDQEVATGDVGELVVHSSTMMRGYWQRPDLDSDAFCRKRDAAGNEALFYRTGDLVVELGEEGYVFRGRKDRQMKVRGYRVELDEVEAVLNAHDDVDEAVSLGWPSQAGQNQVVVLVILKTQGSVDVDALKAFAADKLPAYAVPAEIWLAEELPRTGTNKVDRTAVQGLARQLSDQQPEGES